MASLPAIMKTTAARLSALSIILAFLFLWGAQTIMRHTTEKAGR